MHRVPQPSHTCYARGMDTASVRRLRNDISELLRRVEAGEEITVTVSGRPVARLAPLASRPSSIPWSILDEALRHAAADARLAAELAEALPGTTDDV